jgi:hypothetical protein
VAGDPEGSAAEEHLVRLSRLVELGPRSGQYEITGPRGGDTGKERTVTRGEPMPPTPQPGQGYKIVDPTKNKSGRP